MGGSRSTMTGLSSSLMRIFYGASAKPSSRRKVNVIPLDKHSISSAGEQLIYHPPAITPLHGALRLDSTKDNS